MKTIFIASFALFLLLGCKKKDTSIMARLHYACKDSSHCEVWLNHLTEFEWDKVYFFREYIDTSSIYRKLNIKYEYQYERSEKTVFIKKDSIVFVYENPIWKTWLGSPKPTDYFFYFPEHVCAMQFTPQNACFSLVDIANTGHKNVKLIFISVKNLPFNYYKCGDSCLHTASDSMIPPSVDKLNYL